MHTFLMTVNHTEWWWQYETTDVEALKCVRVNRGKGGSHDIQQHKETQIQCVKSLLLHEWSVETNEID